MLPKEQNELITRTARDTPLGRLMRRYWIPAVLSEEIPEPDCPPVQVRLLGEQLVAFRDSQGRIGLLGETCLHRGTSLFYGRNEECGLRCIYHGWKYDVEGNVLDTPAEPAASQFKTKLRHLAYPTHEAAGMVWAYLGPADKKPLFPNLRFCPAAGRPELRHQVPVGMQLLAGAGGRVRLSPPVLPAPGVPRPGAAGAVQRRQRARVLHRGHRFRRAAGGAAPPQARGDLRPCLQLCHACKLLDSRRPSQGVPHLRAPGRHPCLAL